MKAPYCSVCSYSSVQQVPVKGLPTTTAAVGWLAQLDRTRRPSTELVIKYLPGTSMQITCVLTLLMVAVNNSGNMSSVFVGCRGLDGRRNVLSRIGQATTDSTADADDAYTNIGTYTFVQ